MNERHAARILLVIIAILPFLIIGKRPQNNTEPITTIESTSITETTTQIAVVEQNTIEEVGQTEEQTTTPKYISLGTFKVTAYCSCKKCCGKYAENRPNGIVYGASGQQLIEGYSIAVDPKVIPYSETVIINGVEHVAHDCGGAIKGNRIDLYMASHEEALDWGVQYIEVFKEVK